MNPGHSAGVTIALLCGGNGERMGYRSKPEIELGGRRIIDILYEQMTQVKYPNEVILVGSTESWGSPPPEGATVLDDSPGYSGPLSGIVSSLHYTRNPLVFIVASDMPMVQASHVEAVIEGHSKNAAVSVPLWPNGYIEPLFACISTKKALASLESFKGQSVHGFYEHAGMTGIPVNDIAHQPERVFFNMNSQADLNILKAYYAGSR